ncbi:MAG TPA: PLP-dependent aspartate aminotransferase family protein [Bacteroidales bacterium]|nr:PLP-dependent aspartate aminotransferase family protein [Bacteroidales bacterium]HSA44098.1 PLP-dependent aspartate aminotransferase family protein [Bacteroidales bacterium]
MSEKHHGINTKMIHAGQLEDPMGSATVPIYQSSTFKFKSADHGAQCFSGDSDGYIYTRIGNPTIKALEDNLAALENGFGGIATASGMAAINCVYLAYLGQGDHIVSHNALYGPARGVMESIYPRLGVACTYIDAAIAGNIRDAIRPNTRLIYIETPANPTMGIIDIAEAAAIAHKHNIPLVVDNTFCSPYLQRPLDLGADIVLHSLTKFINGHADIVGGVVIAKEAAHYQKIRHIMVNMGFNMDPHQAFLVIRGVKTLGIRIEKAQQSAMKVASYLENHPKVAWVKYPGLPSHPQYELAKRQMDGPGTMISFEVKGGYESGKILMDNMKLALLAVSLGGVESLIQHPASMTHSRLPKDKREEAGITDGLVRFSVGIEDLEDIIADLDQALAKV